MKKLNFKIFQFFFFFFITTKATKVRSKTPPSKASKIPLRYKEPKQVGEKLIYNQNLHRKSTGDANLECKTSLFEQKTKIKKSELSKTTQPNKKILNDQSTFPEQQRSQKHHKRSQSTSGNQNSSSDDLNLELDSNKKQKDIKIHSKLENFIENDSNRNSIDLVEMKVKKISSAFGSNSTISNFLEKTKELKIIPNISQLSHTKDLFSQMVQEIQSIRIRNYLPKELKSISCPIMQQRIKSMKQVRAFELAINYMQNEFELFKYKIQKNSEDIDHSISDRLDILYKENEKLKVKVDFLQKQIKEKNDKILNSEEMAKKELILLIKELLMQINSQKESNIDEFTKISEKFEKFSESNEKLLSSFILANKQIKKLEKAKFSILEKNAKTVTMKGKVYNEKMIDDEISQLLIKKENILNGLDKIESHEMKTLSSMKFNFDE